MFRLTSLVLLVLVGIPASTSAQVVVYGVGPAVGAPVPAVVPLTFEYYSRYGSLVRYGYPVLGPRRDRFYGFGPRYTLVGSQWAYSITFWPYLSYQAWPVYPQVTLVQPYPVYQVIPLFQPVPVPQLVPLLAAAALEQGKLPEPAPQQAPPKPVAQPFNQNGNQVAAQAPLPPAAIPVNKIQRDWLPPAEVRRLLEGGDAAFAEGSYADAKRWYAHAVAARPREAAAHFRLAQAHFALGEFPEAANAISTGMELRADWPRSAFRPRELYGERKGDFAVHLGRLAEAIAQTPDDERLLFLLGHQLWFSGKQDEAGIYFRQAHNLAGQFQPVRPFLQARAR